MMDLATLFIVLSIFLILLILLGQLFIRRNRLPAIQTPHFIESRCGQKAYVENLKEIRKLEIDFQSGIVSEGEYSKRHQNLEEKGSSLLEQLDAARPAVPAADDFLNSQIEELVEKRRMTRSEKSAGFCTRCGKPVQKSDKYCPFCGRETS